MMSSLFTFVLAILNTVLRGYIIKTYWAWFMLTQFPNLPKMSILVAIGLSYFISVLCPSKSFTAWDLENSQKEYKGYSIALINQCAIVVVLLVSLFFGWLIHLMM